MNFSKLSNKELLSLANDLVDEQLRDQLGDKFVDNEKHKDDLADAISHALSNLAPEDVLDIVNGVIGMGGLASSHDGPSQEEPQEESQEEPQGKTLADKFKEKLNSLRPEASLRSELVRLASEDVKNVAEDFLKKNNPMQIGESPVTELNKDPKSKTPNELDEDPVGNVYTLIISEGYNSNGLKEELESKFPGDDFVIGAAQGFGDRPVSDFGIEASVRYTLRRIAKGLESEFVNIGSDDANITELFAIATSAFEKVAASYDSHQEDLEALSALASAFDKSGDPTLQKEASAIDELLLSIAAPMDAVANFNLVYDKEINELRQKMRSENLEYKYSNPREVLDKMQNKTLISDAVSEQVKRYRPLEAPLSTRYSPDHPGLTTMRITDGVYQDPVTGKVYNYQSGYKTDRGGEVPGSSVEYQTQDTLENNLHSVFTTRESLNASASDNQKKKLNKSAYLGEGLVDKAVDTFNEAIKYKPDQSELSRAEGTLSAFLRDDGSEASVSVEYKPLTDKSLIINGVDGGSGILIDVKGDALSSDTKNALVDRVNSYFKSIIADYPIALRVVPSRNESEQSTQKDIV